MQCLRTNKKQIKKQEVTKYSWESVLWGNMQKVNE